MTRSDELRALVNELEDQMDEYDAIYGAVVLRKIDRFIDRLANADFAASVAALKARDARSEGVGTRVHAD